MDGARRTVAGQLLDADEGIFGHGFFHLTDPMADADHGVASYFCRLGGAGRFVNGHDLCSGACVDKTRNRPSITS